MKLKLYEKLFHELERAIKDGVLRAGERLPSIRETCRARQLSVTTVTRAYLQLESQGLVDSRPQSGYFVRARRAEPASEPLLPSTPPGTSTDVDVSQLVLSTPNIANPVSQALFLRQGQFQWFRDVDYREQGHITPLSPWVLEQALREAGFAIRAERAVSNPFRRVRKLGWGVRLLAPLFALLSGLPRTRRGELWLVRAEAV